MNIKRSLSMKTTLSYTLLFCFFQISLVEAKDFGIQGELFFLQEENLVHVLQKKLITATQNPSSLIEQIKKKASLPKLANVPPEATIDKTFYYDPTFTTNEMIKDSQGKIVIAKGTRINPLKETFLSHGLLFFDGDNPNHVKWASHQQGAFHWILVNGNPFKLEEEQQRPVFFDQQGYLISKFSIQRIPTRITQEGNQLKIEEIHVSSEAGLP